MVLTHNQRGVLGRMSVAATITALGVFGGIWLSPDVLTPVDDLESRLAFVLRWDLLVVLWLLITIGTLARRRFFNAEDINGSGLTTGTVQSKIHQSVLQNTLEQVVGTSGSGGVCSCCLRSFPSHRMDGDSASGGHFIRVGSIFVLARLSSWCPGASAWLRANVLSDGIAFCFTHRAIDCGELRAMSASGYWGTFSRSVIYARFTPQTDRNIPGGDYK